MTAHQQLGVHVSPRIRLLSPILSPTEEPEPKPQPVVLVTPTKPTSRITASSLLSAFNARASPISQSQLRRQSTGDMDRDLRTRNRVSYAISDDSGDDDASSDPPSTFGTPQKPARKDEYDSPDKISDDGDDDNDIDELSEPAPFMDNRDIPGGRGLRPRSTLTGSAAHGITYAKKKKKRKLKSKKGRHAGQQVDRAAERTNRTQIRHEIATITKAKQDQFLQRHRNLFVPLLPKESYLAKLQNNPPESGFAFNEYKELSEQPFGIVAKMKPYQLRGLSFLVHLYKNGMSGILGDEMGLGKTIQTLALFQYLREDKSEVSLSTESRPFLVVCPLSVLGNWIAEAQKFTPGLRVLRFHGPSSQRNDLKAAALGRSHYGRNGKGSTKRRRAEGDQTLTSDIGVDGPYDIIVTTYETYKAEAGWFKSAFVWRYLVLDEGHKIKNYATDIAKALQGIRAEYRLLLTGTPLQNNLMEMWGLLHWLLPDVFTDKTSDLFKASFDIGRGNVDRDFLDHSRRLLEVLMIRRMKDSPGVNLNLPPKKEVRVFVPLTPFQRKLYMQLLTRETDESLLEAVFRGAQDQEKQVIHEDSGREADHETPKQAQSKTLWQRLRNLVMQLRKCSTHPYQIEGIAPQPNFVGEHVVQTSGKFIAVEKLVRELVMNQKKKILIFSFFTEVLDWTEDLLTHVSDHEKHFRYLRLDGGTGVARRNLNVRLFQDMSSDFKVMLISTHAGGLGINLTAATEAVFMDEDWNPQVDLQAEARCHRIGQTKPVTIYKLCSSGTVEEQMLGRIHKKLYLSAKITESMQDIHGVPSKEKPSQRDQLKEEQALFGGTTQLKSLIRRGAQTLAQREIDINEMMSWDFDTLLSRCEDKSADILADNEPDAEDKWLSTMEKVECAIFDGQRYARNRLNTESATLLPDTVTRKDRRIGKNTTVMIDGFAISKETMGCADWEAVPTMAGKDPRLADVKRAKRDPFESQSHCIMCYDFGDIVMCSGCPRSYCQGCLGKAAAKAAIKSMKWFCEQHSCHDCSKKAADVGNMLFVCRWCPKAFCEHCIEWDKTTLLGDTLDEFDILNFGRSSTAYYVVCSHCNDRALEQPGLQDSFDEQAEIYRVELDSHHAGSPSGAHADVPIEVSDDEVNDDDTKPAKSSFTDSRASVAPSLTDTSTITASGVATPRENVLNTKQKKAVSRSGSKRKLNEMQMQAYLEGELRSVKSKKASHSSRFSG